MVDIAAGTSLPEKPRLRGWLHAVMFPIAILGGLVLVGFADSVEERIAVSIFTLAAALLFGTSALLHRGTWTPGAEGVLRRMDHSNIYVIIAATYTPFAVLAMPDERGRGLLYVVWIGALIGVAFRVLWVGAPRWLYTPVYVALGWVAIFYLSDLLRGAGILVVMLIALGGVLYSAGAVVYGTKWPNPSPEWFGFHEVFHVLTVAAFAAHFLAVSLVLTA
jgi:hemolysin III